MPDELIDLQSDLEGCYHKKQQPDYMCILIENTTTFDVFLPQIWTLILIKHLLFILSTGDRGAC